MKNIDYNNNTLDNILEKISLSESLYEKIETRYENIGKWLNREESKIKEFNPNIYAQGSVRIGTSIQPLANGSYDVDLVCQLNLDHNKKSPEEIKNLIKEEIESYMSTYGMSAKIKESKRCWTVDYADEVSFHVDVLPAILDQNNEAKTTKWPDSAILITDNTFKGYKSIPGEWAYSNPIGYSKWLKEVEVNVFTKREAEKRLQKSLEKIPEYSVTTPLRKSIMLLKRHRDVFFKNNSEIKPASVLITTLAGLSYAGSDIENTWDAIQHIVKNIQHKINFNDNKWIVLNPANNQENFADKWNSNDNLRIKFFEWLDQLKKDVNTIFSFEQSIEATKSKNVLVKSLKEYMTYIFTQKHRQLPDFPEIATGYKCSIIKAFINRDGFRRNASIYKSGDFFPKGYYINFEATTDVPAPYSVYWQVTNTGEEAEKSGDLRGNSFQDSDSKDQLRHQEHTRYKGIHSLECIILKDNKIVAKSNPFIVIIN